MQVMLTIVGTQRYEEDEPQITRLVTEGTLHREEEKIILAYAESELTGLTGTITTFCVEQARVVLTRKGTLESRMVFEVGVEDRSLYDMGFGALMVTVCAERIEAALDENGGTLVVAYSISVEQQSVGSIEYCIEARPIPTDA